MLTVCPHGFNLKLARLAWSQSRICISWTWYAKTRPYQTQKSDANTGGLKINKV